MQHIKTLAIALVGLGVLANDLCVAGAKDPAVQPRADALLRKMSTTLATMKSFRFDAEHAAEVVTQGGQKIQLGSKSSVVVERPNQLRSERVAPASDLVFIYDRGQVTLYTRRLNTVATGQVPDTLEQAIDFARRRFELEAPATALLYNDVYSALMENVVAGRYVGIEEVGTRSCHHLAYRGKDRDWQIWIEDGPRPLPCKYLMTRKKSARSPKYRVEFSNWNVRPKFADAAFVFAPPKDAVKVDLFEAAPAKHARR